MNRTIEFRVWFPDKGAFEFYALLNKNEDTIDMAQMDKDIHYYRGEVAPTVQQFTGKLDVNGVKIFEGDIITSSNPTLDKCIVSYINEEGCFWPFSSQTEWAAFFNSKPRTTFKVIGNVHQNLDLLDRPI